MAIKATQHWQPWHKIVQQWQQHWWLMSCPITRSTSPAISPCSPDGNQSNSALEASLGTSLLVQQWQHHWWLMSCPITGSTSPATSLCSPDGNHSNSALAALAQACATVAATSVASATSLCSPDGNQSNSALAASPGTSLLVQHWQQHWWLMSCLITGSTSPATSLCSPDGNHSS
jgi:hypothetical protein